jgi:hypothetical protein
MIHQSQNVRRRRRLLQPLIPTIGTCSNGDRRPSSVNARQPRRHPQSESPFSPTRARRATARGQTKSTTLMPASRPVAGVRTLVPHPERVGGILLLLDASSSSNNGYGYDHDDLDPDTMMSLPLLCRPPLALVSPYILHILIMRCSNYMHRLSGWYVNRVAVRVGSSWTQECLRMWLCQLNSSSLLYHKPLPRII